MKKISLLIADDHSVVRMGLVAILNLENDLLVCGEAENGEEAARLAQKLSPDVVVMDLMMPGMSGAEATAKVLSASPGSKVMILTTFGTSEELVDALDAGATSAITKNISNEDLVAAIRDTAAGRRRLSPEIAEALQSERQKPSLTQRQKTILESITRGLSNDEISLQMDLSKTRIKQHIYELYEKLGAANRAEAVAIAMRMRLLDRRG